jgi:hypothetical protein
MGDRSSPNAAQFIARSPFFAALTAIAQLFLLTLGGEQAHTCRMTDKPKQRPHDPSKKSIARWINEGGAPKGVDRSTHRRTRDSRRAAEKNNQETLSAKKPDN